MAKRPDLPKTITNPRAWDQSHGTYISGRAALDGVDAAAVAMERKWGCDRLRLLVPPELREKFDRQRYRLAAAVHNGELIDVQRESGRMLLAWSALDAVAEDVGAKPIDPLVWEVALEDGSVAAIVHDTAQAHAVIAEGREVAVYTLDEIGRMISSYPSVMKAKKLWPGATVTRTNKTIGDPLDLIRHATSFDDPIDDLFEPQKV
jgi:hypothetical protein